MSIAYIGLGANLGEPRATIEAAVVALGAQPSIKITRSSSLYLSAPIDAEGGDYVNAVVQLDTALSPAELLSALQLVELQFGRIRSFQNAPRTLDLDLLLYEQLSISTSTLQIPHPRMTQRAFVIVPLIEIAPEVIIPGLGTAHSLLPNLRDQIIQKIGSHNK